MKSNLFTNTIKMENIDRLQTAEFQEDTSPENSKSGDNENLIKRGRNSNYLKQNSARLNSNNERKNLSRRNSDYILNVTKIERQSDHESTPENEEDSDISKPIRLARSNKKRNAILLTKSSALELLSEISKSVKLNYRNVKQRRNGLILNTNQIENLN